MRIGAVLALVLALIGPASAGPCKNDIPPPQPSANEVMPSCRSYLKGTRRYLGQGKDADCVVNFALAEIFSPPEICIPEAATGAQKLAVAIKYIEEHPEDWHLEFIQLVHAAWLDAWPCKP
jgi:hypothetical protein